jgi:outer membrane protein OmpA-like peptidoglycan-associated protein
MPLDFGFVSDFEMRISNWLLTMAHKPKPKQEEEAGESAPLWMISFADMMSLLMAFFVMLSTFSSFGPSEAERLQKVASATLAANPGGWHKQRSKSAVGNQTLAAGQLGKGSEKPTLQETQGKGMMKETQAGDFRTRKVFLIESKTVFWGAGTTLSPGGRDFLDTLASFVAKMPDRIVISESGPGPDGDQGFLRAADALNYLTGKGIAKDRCSIAAKGMSPDRRFQTQRMFEIVLLSASVYQ